MLLLPRYEKKYIQFITLLVNDFRNLPVFQKIHWEASQCHEGPVTAKILKLFIFTVRNQLHIFWMQLTSAFASVK